MLTLSLLPLLAAPILASRFPASTDPDASRNHVRQSTYPQTNVTFGSTTIYLGCDVDPAPLLSNLATVCPTDQCKENEPYTLDVEYVSPDTDANSYETLTLSASGQWNPNVINMIAAAQAAIAAPGIAFLQPISWLDADSVDKNGNTRYVRRHCNVVQVPDYMGIVYWTDANTHQEISISLSVTTPKEGFCASFSDISALTGAIVSVLGPGGAIAAAGFGVVSAVCGMDP